VFLERWGVLSNPTRHNPNWFELYSDHLNFCPLAFGFAGGGNNMTKGELRAAISRGYREMSELTKVKCGGDKCPGVGNRAYRCCDRMHCQMTIDHAYKDWGISLPTTGHQLPLMGPTGCTAYPICVLGVRFINAKSRRPALPKTAVGTQNIFAFAIS
jgi:hypothetical protein